MTDKSLIQKLVVTIVASAACAVYVIGPMNLLENFRGVLQSDEIVVRANGSNRINQEVFYAEETLQISLECDPIPETVHWIIDGNVQQNHGLSVEYRFAYQEQFAVSKTAAYVILVVYSVGGTYRVVEKRIYVQNKRVVES